MRTDVDTAIIGAGLGGLFVAAELRAAGLTDLLVIDRAADAGGLVRSIEEDGYCLEPGAGSFLLPHPHLSTSFAQLDAEVVPATPESAIRYVYARDRLHRIAPSPKSVLAPVVSIRAKLRAAAELRMAKRTSTEPEESLHDFLVRRFGREVGALGGTLAAAGVFAGDPKRLSASAAFPTLTGLEQEYGSILKGMRARMRQRPEGVPKPRTHVPAGSMKQLAFHGAGTFGDRVEYLAEVASVRPVDGGWVIEGPTSIRARNVVVALDPSDAAEILPPEFLEPLTALPHAPVAVVGLGGLADALRLPNGFGVLPGHGYQFATRGVLFESEYAPHRAPTGHVLAKSILGGAGREHLLETDDDSLIETAVNDLATLIGGDPAPTFARVVRHPRGIPQYGLGHAVWRSSVERLVGGLTGLHLAGWGYHGVGLTHLATDARRIRARVLHPTT